MKRFVKVALCQRSSNASKEENLKQSSAMIEEAVANCPGLDVIAFPEFNYYLPSSAQDAQANGETVDGRYISHMRELAKKHNVNILPGSFAELCGNPNKTRNTCVFINRGGEIIGKFSKIHLMDAIGVKESDFAEPGNEICVFDADFGRIGIMVCFDLRFPELPRSMVLQGADIIFCPANFPAGAILPPRVEHWDTLVGSTALLNLTWVCAINQYGPIQEHFPFGRSKVVDPWGTAIASAPEKESIVYATLDMEYEKEIRERVASLKVRRPEIYKL